MHCGSDLVSFFLRFGVKQAGIYRSRLWEETHASALFVLACYHLMLDCINGTKIALIKIMCLNCL